MLVIVDFQTGNLGSIANMLKKVGVRAIISSDPSDISKADKLILPGIGAFDNGMNKLNQLGLIDVLNDKVQNQKTPIFGICLGMQLLTKSSEEGQMPGLGWIDGKTVKFKFQQDQKGLKIPHMGWNYIEIKQPNKLFHDMPEESRFYFVHSYHVEVKDNKNILTSTKYGYEFPSIIRSDNILGAQFHPEKSHRYGKQLLRNFVEYY